MSEWKKIGCAVDFSDPARLALAEAVEQARRTGAEVVLVHVHVPPPANPSDVIISPAEIARMSADEMERTLAGWRADAEKLLGRAVSTATLVGDPAGEIVRWAREHGPDLLVLGTHGRKGIRRFILGSVAERVLREAPCPVLVARARVPGEAGEVAAEAANYA
ncbi:universal stress protein [Anaeromyxobacter terrae]|uniref:universal stress protein n=1 Tax=Anaeromyxobacter terrae TaxID=2925406 RepID=UPI001F573E50|nr:universal stress protein [Anaeromyxobacter sp. SG22]